MTIDATTGGAEAVRLEMEKRVDQLQLEIAKVRAERETLDRPWWRRGSSITALTAIVAAIIPVTSAINGHFEKERELELETIKQTEQIRSGYLDRLKSEPIERQRTLRFLIETTSDTRLKAWAISENVMIEKDIHQLESQIDDQKKIAAEATRGVEVREKELAESKDALARRDIDLQLARENAERQTATLADLRRQLQPSTPAPASADPPASFAIPRSRLHIFDKPPAVDLRSLHFRDAGAP